MIELLISVLIFCIPFFSRYLGKIYPFNWEILYKEITILIKNKNTKHTNNKKHYLSKNLFVNYKKKKRKLFVYSLSLSFLLSMIHVFISSNILLYTNQYNALISICFFIIYFLFIFMFEIDKRYYIIPDIFSYPFILFSFLFNSMLLKFVSDFNLTPLSLIFANSILDSAIGGLYGYFSSVIITIIFHKKYPNSFGNGDIKLLSALGVLVGVNKLYQVVIISFVLFLLYSIISRKKYMPYASILFPSFLIYISYILIVY